MSIVTDLADAIDRQEGPDQNNNPGNIWDGLDPANGKTRRIWPELPIDGRGFVIYPSRAAGRAALEHDLSIKIGRGMDLRALLTQYAPPSQNDTETYIRNVSTWTGIPTDVPLNRLDQFQPSAGGEVVAYNPPPDDPFSDVFGPQDPSTVQAGVLPGAISPAMVLGLLIGGLILYFLVED
jgi:hypothetical protein